jgi:mono/diheme cytochrome c family protein
MNARRLLPLIAAVLACACSEQDAPAPAQRAASKPPATATSTPPVATRAPPERIYAHYCQPCHAPGPGHPGTMRLAERLGPDKAVLLERDDLAPQYVSTIVRQGLLMMPPFRPSEIPDTELETLAAYVAGGGRG